MKIDIHTHTRRAKSGDALTREISATEFCERVSATDVKIIAITNHNIFDLAQFKAIISKIPDGIQVWPGIELDIQESASRGHLLVIVSPTKAAAFSKAVERLTGQSKPDKFAATIEDVLKKLDNLHPVYVGHYRQKKPSLSDQAVEALIDGTKYPNRVLREVTNSISAGIYISHGHASIYGSDVHDWARYGALAADLPDLRLPVDSFDQFCLLLEKDQTTINTALNKKTREELILQPFDDDEYLKLQVFNDINVIFGPKGTGKSCILRAIAKHYSENGLDAKVYEPANDRLNEIFDTKGEDITIDLRTFGIDYCTNEIATLRGAHEVAVVSLSKYEAFFSSKATNKNARRILLKEIELEEESGAKRDFLTSQNAFERTTAFVHFLSDDRAVKAELDPGRYAELMRIISDLQGRLEIRRWEAFVHWRSIGLLNGAITLYRSEVERKTGTPSKPATTGFKKYAMNRVRIEQCAAKVLKSVDSSIPAKSEPIGGLGAAKGVLELRTELQFQDGNTSDRTLAPLARLKKTTQKEVARYIRAIRSGAYREDVFQLIAQLNGVDDVQDVKSVYELLLFRRYFALGGHPYRPSSGEASMVLLQKELARDGEIYILDEPERSLGNEYISDVIVPLIRERARAGKKVFISTHDANIAVRTLPYCSIYRCHGKNGYSTYIGNPFSNKLISTLDDTDRIDWKEVSMRTLEGGPAAFGERGEIYGHG